MHFSTALVFMQGTTLAIRSPLTPGSTLALRRSRDSMLLQAERTTSTTTGACILWNGSLFGRLSKSGKDYLLRKGFRQQSQPGTRERLAFVWPSKSGPQFETTDTTAPTVRPYPKHVTDLVDDKIRLAELFQSVTEIVPKTIVSPKQASANAHYFVKHRYGAQGKSVYYYSRRELIDWWEHSKNRQDFVIQQEIVPVLWKNRKFVLRAHILLFQRAHNKTHAAFLHEHVICQHHASEYNSGLKSAQISHSGARLKKHPSPVLIQDLDPSHPAAAAWDKIVSVSQVLVSLFFTQQQQLKLADEATCFALLGVDLLMDDQENIKICEVNTHPALGWGTMARVPPHVFTKLVEDTLSVLVFRNDSDSNGFQVLGVG
jgi:hypothetical protein